MRKHVVVFVSALSIYLSAGLSVSMGQTVQTQPPAGGDPFGGRIFANLSGAFQGGVGDVREDATFPLYEQDARLRIDQSASIGAQFDFGAGYRLRRLLGFQERIGVGFAYSRGSGKGSANVTGALPHPFVFGQPREVSASIGGLRRTENAIHLQGIWWIPFTEEIDFALSAGPSIFVVRQDLARGVVFTEVPPFTSVQVQSVEVSRPERNGAGFNIGVDATYRLRPRIRAGVLLRYSRGWVKLNLTDTTRVSIHPGGFQIGAGVRTRFDFRLWRRRPKPTPAIASRSPE